MSSSAPMQIDRVNRLLAAFPTEILANLDSKTVPLTQGAVIYEPGTLIDRVYFPQSGLISLTIVTKDGESTEAAIVGREGAVGLHASPGKRRTFTRAVTQIGGTCTVVSASKIEQAANGSGYRRNCRNQNHEERPGANTPGRQL